MTGCCLYTSQPDLELLSLKLPFYPSIGRLEWEEDAYPVRYMRQRVLLEEAAAVADATAAAEAAMRRLAAEEVNLIFTMPWWFDVKFKN